MKPSFTRIVLIMAMGLVFSSCRDRDKKGNILDNATSGSIRIAVDESLRPLLEAELGTFHNLYVNAKINATYTSEAEAVEALLNDSVRLAIVTRQLTPDEKQVLTKLTLIPRQTKIAKDAVALILHRDNPDTVFDFEQLTQIVKGSATTWKQLFPKSRLTQLEVVFDNPRSGIVRYLQDSVAPVKKLPSNFYAVNNNAAVVDYVSKNPNAIGLIGVSWISDRDDSTTRQFLKSIRVASISRNDDAVQPYQAYIATRQYPLCRDVYIISREVRVGLGTGFTAFVAHDKGQRIVLKSGMVPATMPVRIVSVNKNPIQ